MPKAHPSIARLVIATVLGVTTLATAAMGGLSYLSSRAEQLGQLREQAVIEADQLAASLSLSVWNLDDAQAISAIRSTMQNQAICAVQLRANDMNIAYNRDDRWQPIRVSGPIPDDGLIVVPRQISHDNHLMGTLRLIATPQFVEEELAHQLKTLFIRIAILDLLLVLILSALLWRIVIKPLKRIEHYAHAVSTGDASQATLHTLGFHGELESLRLSIQNMVQLLENRFKELGIARDQAEAASKAKDRFLAATSHELRTPLTPALLLSSSLVNDPSVPPEVREDLQTIHQSIEIEKRLVSDLLDFAAVSSGKLTLRPRDVDLHDIIGSTIAMLRNTREAKHISLTIALSAKTSVVHADPGRLQQVFTNILSNAIKFTPENGSIQVSSSTPASGGIDFRVQDSGRGIAPEVLPRLFAPFEQGGRSTTSSFGGLGLGLAISKAIIEGHGGTLTIASEGPDRGATVSLHLPVTQSAQMPPVRSPTPPATLHTAEARPMNLLVVEDHIPTLQSLRRLLTADGHHVCIASTMAQALAAAERESFHLLLSDIGLPDGSCTDIMRALRDSKGLRGIAISGYGADIDQHASLQAGFIAHLNKPINVDTLRSSLAIAAGQDAHHPLRSDDN